jgi:hypothetical protein
MTPVCVVSYRKTIKEKKSESYLSFYPRSLSSSPSLACIDLTLAISPATGVLHGLRWRGESSTLDLLWSCDAQSGGHGEEGGDELVRCDVLDEASTFFPPWRAEALQWVVVRPLDGLPALFLAVPHLLPASRGTTTTARRLLRRDALFLFQRYSFSSLSQNKIPT